MTLASIVTPTRPDRLDLLIDRCIPSVLRLDWPDVEHVIVSDRNPALMPRMSADYSAYLHSGRIRVVEINETWRDGVKERSVGAVPWAAGSLLALGEWVGFLGDDDEILPDHIDRHVAAMTEHAADFSISRVQFVVGGTPRQVIGDDTFAHGHLDSDGIMCRATALRTATWTATGVDAADHRLVTDWRNAGLTGVFVDGPPTAIHHDGWAAR